MEIGKEKGRRKGNGKMEVPVEECYIKEVPLVVSNKFFFIHLSFCHTCIASWDFFGMCLFSNALKIFLKKNIYDHCLYIRVYV